MEESALLAVSLQARARPIRWRFFSSEPGQDGEMHLPVQVDGHYPDDRLRVPVTGHQHHAGTNPRSIASSGQG